MRTVKRKWMSDGRMQRTEAEDGESPLGSYDSIESYTDSYMQDGFSAALTAIEESALLVYVL